MRTYYLFVINENLNELYRKDIKSLYKLLYKMYTLKFCDFSYGISIYNQVCHVFDVSVICNYLNKKNKKYIRCRNNKFYINDVYVNEKTCIQVNYSCIVLKTNTNMPYALQIFKWYNNNIFVCDFINNDYFWLNNKKINKNFVCRI